MVSFLHTLLESTAEPSTPIGRELKCFIRAVHTPVAVEEPDLETESNSTTASSSTRSSRQSKGASRRTSEATPWKKRLSMMTRRRSSSSKVCCNASAQLQEALEKIEELKAKNARLQEELAIGRTEGHSSRAARPTRASMV